MSQNDPRNVRKRPCGNKEKFYARVDMQDDYHDFEELNDLISYLRKEKISKPLIRRNYLGFSSSEVYDRDYISIYTQIDGRNATPIRDDVLEEISNSLEAYSQEELPEEGMYNIANEVSDAEFGEDV
ncbi:MAG: hypothetical protein WCG45_00325 [bacterium]